MPPTKKKRGRPQKAKPTEERALGGANDYTLEVIISDKVYSSTAPTMLEALQSIERPQKIVTKGLVVVHHQDRTKELFFMPLQMKRLFYPLAAKATAKMLAMNI